MTKLPQSQVKPTDKYWICSDCAKEKGWESPNWAVTTIKGICGYCERKDETYLIPITDFKRPGKMQTWD